MQATAWVLVSLLIASAGTPAHGAEEPAPVVYTNADLQRLFGPPSIPPGTSGPQADPETDWSLVESVLQREADRRRAEQEIEIERLRAAAPEPPPEFVYPVAWRLGFPASVWWQRVWCAYTGSEGTPGTPGLYPPCPSPEPRPRPVIVPGVAR
jgi:hypothetical protein